MNSLTAALIWLASSLGAFAQTGGLPGTLSGTLTFGVSSSPTVTAVNLAPSSFVSGAPTGTTVGTITVAMSSGSFSGSLALSGASASNFTLVGSTLQTNGALACTSYALTITATQGSSSLPLNTTITCSSTTVQTPGPSAAVYAAPFYTCTTNEYVATSGSDTTGTGSSAAPWATLAHAQTAQTNGTGGVCINVAAGTYTGSLLVTAGGAGPTAGGYLVYRCQGLDTCHILASGGGHLVGIKQPANFVVFDGFNFDGNNTSTLGGLADACVGSDGDTYGTGQSSHHIWLLNNIMQNCNLAGISLNNKEWYYILHNTVENNAWTSGYQGSGIGMVVVQCIESGNANCASGSTYAGGTGTYTPSGMDTTYGYPFHILVQYNNVHGNQILSPANGGTVACGSHTDGNGIIFDTWLDETNHTLVYPYQSLASGNLTYSNGGRGIHVFSASNVTVANNTGYGDAQDICNNSYGLGELSQAGGDNNLWINNIAVAVQTTNTPSGCNTYCGGQVVPLIAGNGAYAAVNDQNNTYKSNLLYTIGAAPSLVGVGAGQPLLFNYEQSQQITASLSTAGVLTVSATAGNLLAQGTYLSAGSSFGATLAEITSQLTSTASGGALGGTGTYQTGYSGSAVASETMTTGVVLASQNKFATNPDLINPTTNFALSTSSPASPAISYGLTEGYLPTSATDDGACPSSASQCP
jgi:parallel beta-helix repeat protein